MDQPCQVIMSCTCTRVPEIENEEERVLKISTRQWSSSVQSVGIQIFHEFRIIKSKYMSLSIDALIPE